MARNPGSPLLELVLPSASLLLSEASVISPTLPELAEALPDAGRSSVQSLVTVGSVAGMVSTVVAGALTLVNWKAAFFVHAFSLVCLVLFARFIPEPPAHTPADEPAAGSRHRGTASPWTSGSPQRSRWSPRRPSRASSSRCRSPSSAGRT
ncbi:hypothetical protein [Kineococcus arenarius]|uniref:hypothetical protein n=1 Tax=Kineococcus sp. SYSU DK007 TaxID=3383128 RepID=UPI003D7D0220